MRILVTAVFLAISVWTVKDALAECECVLWEHIMRSGHDFEADWTLHHAYETNDLCENGRQQAWEAKEASMEKEALGSPQVEVKKVPGEKLIMTIKAKDGFDTTWTHSFQCLPDRIDPREKKG